MSESAGPQTDLFERPMPAGYRDELMALEAETGGKLQVRTGSILLLQLGDLRLAVPTRVVCAVGPVLHIARIPHRSGTVLLGVVAYRGEILPCCSLSRILDLPDSSEPAPSAVSRTLVLEESPGRLWAVPIDGVLGIRSIDQEYARIPSPLDDQWIAGSFREGLDCFHVLNTDTLFRQITLATA